jgi:hypothetical protein
MIIIDKPKPQTPDIYLWLEYDHDEVIIKSKKDGHEYIEGRFYEDGKKYLITTKSFPEIV